MVNAMTDARIAQAHALIDAWASTLPDPDAINEEADALAAAIADALATAASDADAYLVWSNEHTGWWRPGSLGYSPGLKHAGHYTREQALDICARALPTAAHIGLISEIPVRLPDLRATLERGGGFVPAAIFTGER
jgi:hypothetical protein